MYRLISHAIQFDPHPLPNSKPEISISPSLKTVL